MILIVKIKIISLAYFYCHPNFHNLIIIIINSNDDHMFNRVELDMTSITG